MNSDKIWQQARKAVLLNGCVAKEYYFRVTEMYNKIKKEKI